MSKIKIHDWEVWQTFRKDRGTPPWIKIHRSLLSNKKWASLSDAEKGQLVSMWMVAADDDGKLPDDATVIRKICQLDENPNLIKFKELGFVTTACQPDDNQMTTACQPDVRHVDAPETETETEKKKETPKGVKKKPPKKVFVPPEDVTMADAEDIITEHGLDHGKVKLLLQDFQEGSGQYNYKNHRAAFRKWVRRDIEKLKKPPQDSRNRPGIKPWNRMHPGAGG